MAFDTEWTRDRVEENEFINRVRGRVAIWRKGGYQGITRVTRGLLDYWTNPEREKKLFFCQIEALETAIYVTEVARNYGDGWIDNELRKANEDANPDLLRIAFKMATGSGKTVVMAMLIAWHVLNKVANPQDARFSSAFLIVTPGITIRDRLRVLLPNDPNNYYRERDLLPPDSTPDLGRSRMIITNFHAFKLRELSNAAKLTKEILAHGGESALAETPDQMVRRVCKDFGNKRNIVVINDEAHHCYRRRVGGDEIKLTGEERKEAERREEEARIWITGLEAVKHKIGVKAVYDLSATPFFLRGSGYSEGTLFPWVVSDFSLIDAIECGIVKIPRVPVSDDSMAGELPTYRDIWHHIRDHLPKKGRATGGDELGTERKLPVELEGALHSLYGNYEKHYRKWEENAKEQGNGSSPPVFIVVCNNTNVSKLVYDYISGWAKPLPDGSTVIVPGHLAIFRNHDDGNRWLPLPNTILIDSQQLESGEGMSKEFKQIAAHAIEEFKHEYHLRFPDRDVGKLTDEDLLREVMNTVGKPGKLGEHIKCVVSVSMLTEGWDANTVTHILGVRAFGTQLLCEQVVGRGLRRTTYATNERGWFDAEYAEVYGVPFSFIPCSGSSRDPKPGPMPTRVRALPDRLGCEITFPRVTGYRYEISGEHLDVCFGEDAKMALSTHDLPTRTENAPLVGEISVHTLYDLSRRRLQEVEFDLAKRTLEKYFRDDGGSTKHWLFPQLVSICRRWISECLVLKDNAFVQMLLMAEKGNEAASRIYKAIVSAKNGPMYLRPILRPYDWIGSTRHVDFDTTRPVYATDPNKCHISHVVADTESWEQKMAAVLEDMDEVACYAKNQNLGFTIPYTVDGEDRGYIPDFLVKIDAASGEPLYLIIEVSGWKTKDKEAKVSTARSLWVPAVNNHGGFGRWAFLEISDPWDAKKTIRTSLKIGLAASA